MTNNLLHATNNDIAQNYDALIYDPAANPHIDLARIWGHASLFGRLGTPCDVLDIGCGTGAQLASVASLVSGRVLGIDISEQACALAKERLTPFGERANVICGDLLEIEPEAIGQFDVIYNIGVIYVTPPQVQARILELIGKCLKPGGIAVISYYTGSVSALRANMHTTLRNTCAGLPRNVAVNHARGLLQTFEQAGRDLADDDLRKLAISATMQLPDTIFFHEVLNNAFEPMRTSAVERTLSQYGVSFASYLPPAGTDGSMSSSERAFNADWQDFLTGYYRYAVFAKYDGNAAESFGSRPQVWQSQVTRTNRGVLEGQQSFVSADGTFSAGLGNPASIAMADCLIDGPLSWEEITARVRAALEQAGIPMDAGALGTMEADLRELWRHGLMLPLASNG